MKFKKVFVYVYACNRRRLDAKKVCKYLHENNHEIVKKPKDADIILIFTCAAVDEETRISFKKVKKFLKYDKEVIVAGCLPAIERNGLDKIFNGKTISTKELDKIESLFPRSKIEFKRINDANLLFQNIDKNSLMWIVREIFDRIRWIKMFFLFIKSHAYKHIFKFPKIPRYFHIRISWGCNGNCSYCTIKNAIGSLRSKPMAQCLSEFKKGLKGGYLNFVIDGDDVGSYGIDIGSNFSQLMNNLTKVPGNYKLKIEYLSPRWVIKYIDKLKEILKRNKITEMNIPIQSGSERILKLMHRYSDTEKIENTILKLREFCPELILSTHIIVGFPTETNKDFRRTLSLVKNCCFSMGNFFQYSHKNNSEAAYFEPKIHQKEINKRFKYAKKFLKKEGYHIFNLSKMSFAFYK